MRKVEKLQWALRRVSRMSAAEIAHRVQEQIRRRSDGLRGWSWSDFGSYEGGVAGLSGVTFGRGSGELDEAVLERAARAVRGEFVLLGQHWPQPVSESWWRTDFWFVDPVTHKNWPGADVYCFDVNYRHASEFGDVKFVWELNRLQFLTAVGLGAQSAGDRSARIAFEIVRGWMEANPPFRGINWVSGIEAASRLVSILALISIVGVPPSDFLPDIKAFVAAHVFWIARYPSRYSSANNHRIAEMSAIFIAAGAAPGITNANALLGDAQRGLEAEVHHQFHEDGVGAEQSPTYSAYSLEWFALTGVNAKSMGRPFSAAYFEKLKLAVEHLRWMLDDGGRTPRIGDDDEGRVLDISQSSADQYVANTVVFSERCIRVASEGAEEQTEVYVNVGKSALADIGPGPTGVRTFESGGYSVIRQPTDRGTALFVFDHAPLGFLAIAAHGHADALSVWLHWGDEPIFVDSGTFLYHSGGLWRDSLRGTNAHNTLILGGADQSDIAGAFNWSRHAETKLEHFSAHRIAGAHNGYRKQFGVSHHRGIAIHADRLGWDVEDKLIGEPTLSSVPWVIGFNVAPNCRVKLEGRMAHVYASDGRAISCESLSGYDWEVGESVYSPGFNVKEAGQRILLRGLLSADEGSASLVRIRLAASSF
ncbi:alginate lyase family protein [Phenylobacterium conjunctum]|uniref:Alginate lyase family protein n=1 Tax=Phenylobacterium conjunctum TaxID=1298959 RepID=A0ABW3T7U2_9CAUL